MHVVPSTEQPTRFVFFWGPVGHKLYKVVDTFTNQLLDIGLYSPPQFTTKHYIVEYVQRLGEVHKDVRVHNWVDGGTWEIQPRDIHQYLADHGLLQDYHDVHLPHISNVSRHGFPIFVQTYPGDNADDKTLIMLNVSFRRAGIVGHEMLK